MALFRTVFGQLSWTRPKWFLALGARRVALRFVAVALLLATITVSINYYQSLPQPPHIVVNVHAPGPTPIIDGKLQPQPLDLTFSVKSDPRMHLIAVESVAAIGQLGKTLDDGISIEPRISGQWSWLTENSLRFQPTEDWPAGQAFVVRYDPTLFAENLLLTENEARFTTPEFSTEIEELLFYQDPLDTSQRKVVATLNFSHPVNIDNLKSHLSYKMRAANETIDRAPEDVTYTVQLGPLQRVAYVHSAQIEIPAQENYLSLQIAAGLRPIAGPSELRDDLLENVLIPDIDSYFRVSGINSIIARDDDGDPIQTLTMEFTDQVRTDRLQEKLTAYLLPTRVRVDGSWDDARRWRTPREITPEVLLQSEKIDIELTPTQRGSAMLHSAAIDLPERRTVYLKVASGLTSDGNFNLGQAYDDVIYIPPYPKEATIAQAGAILPLTGSHQLTFISRGVDTLRVELGRLIDDDINHLASQTGGSLQSPYFNNYQFNKDNLTTRVSRTIDLNAEHPGKSVYSSLDLSEYLPDGGYYFVNVQGWDKERDRPIGSSDQRFILITDTGLLVKANADNTQDVFVHSIATGKPIADAQIELLGKNGIPIIARRTSTDGHVSMPASNGFEREKTPTVYVVRHGNDSVFMPFARHGRKLQYSRFDIGGQYVQRRSDDEPLRAQVFTDRGIYRPGDTVNIAAIVKRDDWQSLENVPLVLHVTDARGRTALEKQLRLPKGGFLDTPFGTDASSATGNYTATLWVVKDDRRSHTIGTQTFKVEEFLPDRLRIRSRIEGQKNKGWVQPDDLVCEINLENLFGTAAQSRRVAGRMDLMPTTIHLSDFAAYVFDDPLKAAGTSIDRVQQDLRETKTDENGNAQLDLNLKRYDKGIYRLNVFSEGFEEGGGRSVKSLASVMMSPLDYLIGHKLDGDFSFLDKGSEHIIHYVAVSNDAESVRRDKLRLSVVEYRYVSTLVKRPNGTYAYQSVRKEIPVSTQGFSIEEDGSSFAIPTAEAGTFAVLVSDEDDLVYSKVDFTIAGARNLAGNLERDSELQVIADGDSFAPGSDIEIQITAPYTGTGLITIERDRVYAYKWFQSDSNTSVQTIRVPEELEGNAYINVAFVRELDSPEIYVSPLSYAVTPFSINRDARKVAIDLDVPELVRPGDELTIGFKTSQDARIVIYGVDEGILQVARYATPDPLSFFLQKMALQVSTYQMVDLILPDFSAYAKTAAPGGGDRMRQLAGNNLNPFRRNTDAPVAFWSGIIDAGTSAESYTWRVPDTFNGELRVMAVAVSDSAVGRLAKSSTVRGPFVISPNVLTAAAPGDVFNVNVGLANNLQGSGDDAMLELRVQSSEHLEIMGDDHLSLGIAEGHEGRGQFRVRVLDKLGAASLTFEANSGQESTQLTATLSVRPAVANVATVMVGNSDDDPIKLRFERSLYDEFAQQSAAASASPLVLADGLLNYLDAYPHACAEQIVSKVFPQIGFLGSSNYALDEAHIRSQFQATTRKLRRRQGPGGGFLFWATSAEPADFASAYIMHFFTDAADLGLSVPTDMRNAGLGFLQQLAAQEVTTLSGARLRAYAIYVLTRNGHITSNYLTNLHEFLERSFDDSWRRDLVSAYMAASYDMLKQSDLGERLAGGYQFGHGEEMTSDFDTRLGRDAQYIYLLARHFPERLADLDSGALQNLINPVMKNRFNTLSSAYTILALGEYTRAIFSSSDSSKLAISSVAGDVVNTLAEATRFVRSKVENSVNNIEISGGNGSDIYYVLSQTGFDQKPPIYSLTHGLEVQKEYLDEDGNTVNAARIGDELTVRLRVRSTARARTNVALVDLLPGGFEVVRDSLLRDAGGWRAAYMDVREDRVVVYGNFYDRISEIRYRVKLSSAGDFIVPAAFAQSMYDRTVYAHSAPERFTVRANP